MIKNDDLEKKAHELGVKFIHIRKYDCHPLFNGDMFGEDELNPHGGKTIAFRRLNDDEVAYSIAKCSERDHYCKRTGRIISAGRLLANRTPKILKVPKGADIYDAFFDPKTSFLRKEI